MRSAGGDSGDRSELCTPPSSSSSEANDFHSLNSGSYGPSSDADDTPEMYAALARRLDIELNEID